MATEKTERQIVVLKLRSAKGNLARATSKAEALKVEWTETITPEWSRYIKAQGAQVSLAHTVRALSALLDADQPSPYSVRNIGFNGSDELQIDGDWVADLDANGEEMCLECAHKALLAGDVSPNALHVCYSYIQDRDYAIYCSDCKALIRLGAYAYVVVDATDLDIDGEDSQSWDYSDYPVPSDDDNPVMAWYEDGREPEATAYADTLAALTPGRIYQVRYIDPQGDRHSNAVTYTSTVDLR